MMTVAHVILDIALASLSNTVVDLDTTTTPKHFRLVDCRKFVDEEILRIFEYEASLPNDFAAISYVWRGNPLNPNSPLQPSFAVKGAEDGDPITISVLHHACSVAIMLGANTLWLDRLCILQTSRIDRAWQIINMSSIYKNCLVCIVLPGGLGRLVNPSERTDWINRAWTLQEVTLPRQSVVLFEWKNGSTVWKDYDLMSGKPGDEIRVPVTEVIPELSAFAPFLEILRGCFHSMNSLLYEDRKAQKNAVVKDIRMIGPSRAASVGSLLWVLEVDDPVGKSTAIWQSALLRTSSRPVDMIFSIMHLFDVALNPLDFSDKNDRIGVTIALAQLILRNGGKPTWLGIILDIKPSQYISSFPELPKTHVEGIGQVSWTAEKSHFFAYRYGSGEEGRGPDLSSIPLSEPGCWAEDLPSGDMDNEGYLTITTKSAPVKFTGDVLDRRARLERNLTLRLPYPECGAVAEGDILRVTTTEGEIWEIMAGGTEYQQNWFPAAAEPKMYILKMGTTHGYPGEETWKGRSLLKNIIVQEHQPGRFHRIGTWSLNKEMFEPIMDSWGERTFAIGGPRKPSDLEVENKNDAQPEVTSVQNPRVVYRELGNYKRETNTGPR